MSSKYHPVHEWNVGLVSLWLPIYFVRVGCDNSAGEGYPGVECLIVVTCSLSRHLIQISK
jgi:hypothetical protein